MEISLSRDSGQARITLAGRFDFNAHRQFRRVCDEALEDPQVKELELDLRQVEYLDSSALGMLLLLKDKAQGRGKSVVLSGVQGTVKQVLDIAHFGKLFTMRS